MCVTKLTIIMLWAECLCSPRKNNSARMLICLSCLTLCIPLDCSPLGSSVRGISQARILEWVAISSSRGSSWPRDWIHISYVSCIGRWVLLSATWDAPNNSNVMNECLSPQNLSVVALLCSVTEFRNRVFMEETKIKWGRKGGALTQYA